MTKCNEYHHLYTIHYNTIKGSIFSIMTITNQFQPHLHKMLALSANKCKLITVIDGGIHFNVYTANAC